MSEQNNDNVEPNDQEWEAPPIPEEIQADQKEEPEMSEIATLGNVFIEPGRTFEDLRKKPRFIIAFVIIAILSTSYMIALSQKVGDEQIRRELQSLVSQSGQFQSLSASEQEDALNLQIFMQRITTYASPLLVFIVLLLGGLFYWLGMKAFGSEARFWHGVSVFTYSSLPYFGLRYIGNLIVLYFKPAEEIAFIGAQRGVVDANPNLFLGSDTSPVLTTILSAFDVFLIWGLILAAIGLKKVGRISSGSAWTVVLLLTLIWLTFRVIVAFFQGTAI
ncbi:MAG TPA: Yip1 family protein [Aridibacter sp.]|nr:Yip1 family protein [Aridibacter sp.]